MHALRVHSNGRVRYLWRFRGIPKHLHEIARRRGFSMIRCSTTLLQQQQIVELSEGSWSRRVDD